MVLLRRLKTACEFRSDSRAWTAGWQGVVSLIFFSLVLSGCLPPPLIPPPVEPQPFTELRYILINDRLARPDELQVVQILRQGRLIPTWLDMTLEVGDELITGPNALAVLAFAGGEIEVLVRPLTSIRIINPERGAEVNQGSVFVRILEWFRGRFKVKTRYVTTRAQGTEFLVNVTRDEVAIVTVVDGVVDLQSNVQGWRQESIGKLQQAVIHGTQPPVTRPIEPSELNEIIDWVKRVERVIKPVGQTRLLVPQLVGLSESAARQVLAEEQLAIGQRLEHVTASYPPGIIVDQSPPAGERVPLGSRIDIVVAVEPRPDSSVTMVRVPSVLQLNEDQAVSVLLEHGLRLGTLFTQQTGAFPPGAVSRQEPPPGDLVPVGLSVDLWIEEQPGPVTVPLVVGEFIDRAVSILQNSRLQPGAVRYEPTDRAPPETVLHQDPPHGAEVRPDTAVDLVVAEEPREILVEVPSITGLSINLAENELYRRELRLGRMETELTDQYRADTVLEQYPAPGTLVRRGSSVDLVVAKQAPPPPLAPPLEPPCTVPNVHSMTLQEATNVLNQAGLNVGGIEGDTRGAVYQQNPPAGQQVPCGTGVSLTFVRIEQQPPQLPTPRPPSIDEPPRQMIPLPGEPFQPSEPPCTVPNVHSMTLQEATNVLNQAGLNVGGIEGDTRGGVYQQNPPAGQQVPCGTDVSLNFVYLQ